MEFYSWVLTQPSEFGAHYDEKGKVEKTRPATWPLALSFLINFHLRVAFSIPKRKVSSFLCPRWKFWGKLHQKRTRPPPKPRAWIKLATCLFCCKSQSQPLLRFSVGYPPKMCPRLLCLAAQLGKLSRPDLVGLPCTILSNMSEAKRL